MIPCFFVSDLHGQFERYQKLFKAMEAERPAAVFLGGDLFPSAFAHWPGPELGGRGFLRGYLLPHLSRLREAMGEGYPRILVILGNDDLRQEEATVLEGEAQGLWSYLHERKAHVGGVPVFGYAFVPPTPFHLKDWERYDVSRYVPPGSVSPEEGRRSVEVDPTWIRYGTIKEDLQNLTRDEDVSRAVFLFHTPPFETLLDRAALDGRVVDHVPLDLHVGSVAVRRFIEARHPFLTLHGHIHESPRLTGSWQDTIGPTHLFSAAHDGPELALVRFDLEDLQEASRALI